MIRKPSSMGFAGVEPRQHALVEIEKLMEQTGKKLNEYPGVELPNSSRDKGTWKQTAQ
jgi:hypothetical protein